MRDVAQEMFPSLRSMETQHLFCVPRVCAPKIHRDQQWVRNNVFSFASTLRITTPTELLDQLTKCLTHSTLFREKREEIYTARQKIAENTTSYYFRLLYLYRQAGFPENTNFLIADKLTHGCISKDCKRKLMAKGKEVSVKDCLELMRKYEAVEATMKKFEESNDTHVDASYAQDPTKKSQRNGSRKTGPKSKLGGKKSGGKKSCVWCNRDAHPATSAQPRMQHAHSVANKDTLSEPASKRKG